MIDTFPLQWRNYEDPEENTWEPVVNLSDAEKAIRLYEREQETKMAASSKNNKRKNAPGRVNRWRHCQLYIIESIHLLLVGLGCFISIVKSIHSLLP